MKNLLSFLLLLVTAVPAKQSDFHIAVNVDLVLLNVTVRDRKGQLAPALQRSDFEIFEDNVRQAITVFKHEDLPVTVGLVVDHSGSMRQKMPGVIAAARSFASSSNPDDHMFVVNFNDSVTLSPGMFTDGPDALEAAILSRPVAGQTALYDAVWIATERLKRAGPEKKVLIIVSDGSDNASQHTLPDVLATLSKADALVYSIGIFDVNDADRNEDVLRKLARVTGGEAFFPLKHEDVSVVCESIAKEIRTQYSLGYISSNPSRTGVRHLRVTAGKMQVHTRTTYTAGAK